MAHYGPEWREFYIAATGAVSRVLGTEGMSFLVPGSGSLGLEMAASTFCESKKCLVLSNGFFGDRLNEILRAHSDTADALHFGLGSPIDPQRVSDALRRKSYDAIFMTHVETSTGMLNSPREIALIAKERGCLFLLDAVSSAGIEQLAMDAWGVDVVVSASQKGFESPPGLAVLSCRRGLVEKLAGAPRSCWYTHLGVWYDYSIKWSDWHPFPVTVPTNTITALARSLEIMEAKGVSARLREQEETTARLRNALKSLELTPYVKEGHHAHGLTSLTAAGKFEPSELVAFLKQRLGIQIAGSLGELKDSVFRIGHMSRAQRELRNLASVVSGIALFMESKGMKTDLCQALKALGV